MEAWAMYCVHVFCALVGRSQSALFLLGLPVVHLKALKHLDLSRCRSIDDWGLSRLHVFGDTLQELSLAGCPQVTERGLAALHPLE